MNRRTPGLTVHHQLPEFTQIHVHRVSDAIQPSHPLSSPSPPAPNPSQHQSLFQWVNSSHEVAKVLRLVYWLSFPGSLEGVPALQHFCLILLDSLSWHLTLPDSVSPACHLLSSSTSAKMETQGRWDYVWLVLQSTPAPRIIPGSQQAHNKRVWNEWAEWMV